MPRIGRPAPERLPQYTFPEVKAAVAGLTDGPLGRAWFEVDGEVALRHGGDRDLHQVKFVVAPLARWLGLPSTTQSLWDELRRLGLPPALLYHVCLARLLDQTETAVMSLDVLIRDIGWEPRSTAERHRMRRGVWRWLTAFDGWTIIGRRKGHYPDPLTRRVPDLWIDSALFRILERGYVEPEQLALDGSAPPFEVTLAAGPWLSQFRGNRQVLSYFGDVRLIAAIPARKPGGAWAQSVGLALQQRWREQASNAVVGRTGESKALTVRLPAFTRSYLLNLFPPSPAVDEVLRGPNPARAKHYWSEAIAALKDHGIVSFYKEQKQLTTVRQAWANDWLDQPLDIRPALEGKAAIAEIAHRAKGARAGRRRGVDRAREMDS